MNRSWLAMFGMFTLVTTTSLWGQDDIITPAEIARMTPQQQERLVALGTQLEQAEALYEAGKYAEFLPQAEKLTKEIQEILGTQHRLTALALTLRGSANRLLDKYDASQPLLEQALAIQLKLVGERHAETATTLYQIGLLHLDKGEFDKSKAVLDRCLKVRRQLFGNRHADVAEVLMAIGQLANDRGDYEQALDLMGQALAIQRATLGDMDNLVAETLNGLGRVQNVSGDLLGARANFEKAYAIRKQTLGEKHPDTAATLNNLGMIYDSLGDLPAAQTHYEKALAVMLATVGEKSILTAKVMMNLGEVCMLRKDMPTARKHLERANSLTEALVGPKHQEYVYTSVTLGRWHLENESYAEAQKLFERGLAISEANLGKDKLISAAILAKLTELYQAQGDLKTARNHNEEALRMIRASVAKESSDMAVAVGNLATLDAGLQDWPSAGAGMDDARRRIRRLAVNILPGLSDREILKCLEQFDSDFRQTALSLGYIRRDDQRFIDLSAAWLINGKGLAEESLAIRQSKLQKKGLLATAVSDADPWIELAAVRSSIPAKSLFVDIARIKIRNFSAHKKAEHWDSARYVAWVMPPTDRGSVQLLDLGDADTLDAEVKATRDAIKAAMNDGTRKGAIAELGEEEAAKLVAQPLAKLAARVIKPLEKQLAGVEHLILSPDAALWLAPWDALPVEGKEFLIEKHSLTFVVSGRDLATPRTPGKAQAPIIMADPNYDLGQTEVQTASQAVLGPAYQLRKLNAFGQLDENQLRAFSPTGVGPLKAARLSGTAAEAQMITGKIEQFAGKAPLVYTDRYALEGIFKKIAQPRLMVLSTHGYFREEPATKEAAASENPLLRCGLLLAGCNQQLKGTADDGILTGQEIAGTDLRGTELVVLSACETAVGEVRTGDGVAGLRQAFQLAGAQAVVSTLWQIPDRDSALIVNELFANLASGESKAAALRNAQLKRIEARREKYGAAHPFFWAAWTVTGQ